MGTNYYAKTESCACCGRGGEEIHLGKNSGGWAFRVQYNGGRYYTNWSEFKNWVKDKKIEDEYGRSVSATELIGLIELKKEIRDPEEVNYSGQMHIIDGYKFYDSEFC
jgi:hypothetical protein